MITDDVFHKSAEISPNGRYRYRLIRGWCRSGEIITFCMLNPSTADGKTDDPTIRRCEGFARRWGFCGVEVVNLSAYRATDPRELWAAGGDAWTPENEAILRNLAGPVIVAWGGSIPNTPEADRMARIVRDRAKKFGDFSCLGKTKAGEPRHPLFVSYKIPLEAWPK